MKKHLYFLIYVIIFCLFTVSNAGTNDPTGGPELYIDITDNETVLYKIEAHNVGNYPVYDRNFNLTTQFNDAEDTFEAVANTETESEGFDWVSDPGATDDDTNPDLGCGLYDISIIRNYNDVPEVILYFTIDYRWDYSKTNNTPDIRISIVRQADGTFNITKTYFRRAANGVDILELTAPFASGETILIWENNVDQPKDVAPFSRNVEMTNDFSGTPNSQVKIELNSSLTGFPEEQYQDGHEFIAGDFANYWHSVIYGFEADPSLINFQSSNFKIRHWNAPDKIGSSQDITILKTGFSRISAVFVETLPIKVTNNLEGGESGDYEVTWDKQLSNPQPVGSGIPYNAFDYDETLDEYILTALTVSAYNTTWQFQYWGDDPTDIANPKEDIKVRSTSDNSYTAYYKGHMRTNNTSAFSSNNQRKLVRTTNGKYHTVYTSQFHDPYDNGLHSKLWVTSSSTDFDGGWDFETQLLKNSALDLDLLNPSVDYYGNKLFIVCESRVADDASVMLIEYDTQTQATTETRIDGFANGYFGNIKPVIGVSESHIMVAWKPASSSGYKYWVWDRLTNVLFDSGSVGNTNNYCFNLSLVALKQIGVATSKFYMAWDYNQSTLKYQQYNTHNTPGFQDYLTISTGSGHTKNYNPSIALNVNAVPIISWTGRKKIFGAGYLYSAIIKNDPENSTNFFIYESDVAITNCNTATTGESIIAVVENDGSTTHWLHRTTGGLYSLYDLSHSGSQVQVSNGSTTANMKAVVFEPGTAPHVLHKSTTDFSSTSGSGGFDKTTGEKSISYSRQGVVTKGDMEFVFNIGAVSHEGQPVTFPFFPDSIPVASVDDLNANIRTEAFTLNSSSTLLFSHNYYVVNDLLVGNVLSNNDQVHFKVQLINENTGQFVAIIDEVIYNKDNVAEYGQDNYQMDCSGIAEGDYYLQLVTVVNGNADYSLGNGQVEEQDGFGKKNYRRINFSEIAIPLTFKLGQNFPNPFNPLTTISYELPKASKVQIKVYDITGREITTLVNSFKNAGRYQVSFDGSNLATGVYIYKIVTHNFSTQKKMLLVK